MSEPAFQGEHLCQVCFGWVHEHYDPEQYPPRCCFGCGCGVEMPPDEDQ